MIDQELYAGKAANHDLSTLLGPKGNIIEKQRRELETLKIKATCEGCKDRGWLRLGVDRALAVSSPLEDIEKVLREG